MEEKDDQSKAKQDNDTIAEERLKKRAEEFAKQGFSITYTNGERITIPDRD